MIRLNKKLKLLLKIVVVLVLVSILAAIVTMGTKCWYIASDIQTDDAENDTVGVFWCLQKRDDFTRYIEFEGDIFSEFELDTGAGFNTITKANLDYLNKMGCEIEEIFLPKFSKDYMGKWKLTTKCYLISIPLKTIERTEGSVNTVKSKNTIFKIRFFPDSSNLLGMDFLNKYYVEIKNRDHNLILHHKLPDGYNIVIELKKNSGRILDWLNGNRYYMNITFNEKDHLFFLDTGAYTHVPYKEYRGTKPLIQSEFYPDETNVVDFAKLEFNGITSSVPALFENYVPNTSYAVNLFDLIHKNLDFVMDFKNAKIYLRDNGY